MKPSTKKKVQAVLNEIAGKIIEVLEAIGFYLGNP